MILGALALFAVCVLSFLSENKTITNKSGTEDSLCALICCIDGVEEACVEFSRGTSKDKDEIVGIAVVYKGDTSIETKGKVYELISSLYGIPYSRIYVES